MIKNTDKIKKIPFSAIILIILISVLLMSSKKMIMSSANYPYATKITSANAVVSASDVSDSKTYNEEISLPHTFKHLDARTPVTVTTHVSLKADDQIFIKTVYSPAKVYLDGDLIYEFGKAENYPAFMKDPATEQYMISTDGYTGDTELRIKYLSPVTRSSLTIYPPIYGAYKSLLFTLLNTYKWSFLIALLELCAGILFVFISILLLYYDKDVCKMIFHFGFFSFMVGMWSTGECNYTGVLVKNPTLLYLCAFIGLFSQIIPLLHFCKSAVGFKNPRPIIIVAEIITILNILACILQLSGTLAFSQSMYVFHIILPITLCFLTAYIAYEFVHNQNNRAKRLMIPVGILAVASCAEIINYFTKIMSSLSLLSQIGTIIFIVIMGNIMGLNISDMVKMKKENEKLVFDMNLLENSLAEQKRYNTMITRNEEITRKQRHDLRHQLVVIKELAGDTNPTLTEYLDSLIHSIPHAPKKYCENKAVNSIISHYGAICANESIALETKLNVPESEDSVLDNDLCLVFGNMIENAIEACRRLDNDGCFIRLSADIRYKTLIITMDNSFDGHFKIRDGKYLSSKRNDFGIGLSSIQSVAQKYGGDTEFVAKNGVFQSSLYFQIYTHSIK